MTIEQTQTETTTSLVTSVATATMTETETDTVTYTEISTDVQPTTVTSVWMETQTVDNVSFGCYLEKEAGLNDAVIIDCDCCSDLYRDPDIRCDQLPNNHLPLDCYCN